MKEAYHLRQALRDLSSSPVSDGTSQFHVPAAHCHASHVVMDSPSGTVSQNQFCHESLLVMVFYYSRKVTNIINLSVNDANSPIKRCGPNDWTKKLETYCVFSLRNLSKDNP